MRKLVRSHYWPAVNQLATHFLLPSSGVATGMTYFYENAEGICKTSQNFRYRFTLKYIEHDVLNYTCALLQVHKLTTMRIKLCKYGDH